MIFFRDILRYLLVLFVFWSNIHSSVIFGLGILITGIVMKKNVIKNVAYVLFCISAIFGFASMFTGEGAEEIAENLPSVTDQIIHEHEEMAEKLAILLYALGSLSILGAYLDNKKQKYKQNSSVLNGTHYFGVFCFDYYYLLPETI
jgi:hypothetical protein